MQSSPFGHNSTGQPQKPMLAVFLRLFAVIFLGFVLSLDLFSHSVSSFLFTLSYAL